MDWFVYWFMFPGCIAIAAIATFSGISGAALLTPIFIIGFPLFGVPTLTTVEAIATSLFLETSGFGTGVYRYLRMKLADLRTARLLIAFTLPLGALGSVLAYRVPAQTLRIGYGIAMIGVAWLLFRGGSGKPADRPCPCLVAHSDRSHENCRDGEPREVHAVDKTYRFCAHGLRAQVVFSAIGAVLAGLISTGVGEATLPTLVRKSRFPVAVAAATSTLVVAGTVLGASITHVVELAQRGGLGAVPWNLIVWGAPGAMIGAMLGTRFQGRVSEHASRMFFSALFLVIGVTFLVAFTIFAGRFTG